ncbi:MAG: RES family NAD+ phosphorylase [Verrucomicrobia bacterium]|nr:RES family NAD+ phosphorylase [Verrucomicrobiota bacterium]
MSIQRVRSHPRFAELRDLFRAHPEWFEPWTGTLFRFQTVDYPAPKHVLSGEGARQRGGRWNPPGLAALYGSVTDTAALEECKSTDRYYGVATKSPRLLVAIDARLTRVLDLTKPAIFRKLGFTLSELAAEDWRKLLAAGRESLTQSIGRAVAASGGSGLLARSAAVHRGVNVVVFPGLVVRDRLAVVEGQKFEQLALRSRG